VTPLFSFATQHAIANSCALPVKDSDEHIWVFRTTKKPQWTSGMQSNSFLQLLSIAGSDSHLFKQS